MLITREVTFSHRPSIRVTAEVSLPCPLRPRQRVLAPGRSPLHAAVSMGLHGPNPVPTRAGPGPRARSACSPLVAERTGCPSRFPPMAGEAASFLSGRQRRSPQPASPPPLCARCPRPLCSAARPPPVSGASSLRAPPSGSSKCSRLGAQMSSRPLLGEAGCRGDRRAREWLCVLVCPARAAGAGRRGACHTGEGRAARELAAAAPQPLTPRSLVLLCVCGHELSGCHSFLCFLIVFFNCLKASVTVKPGPEPLAPRRRLVQEQEGRPAEARHQRHAVLALSAHRGKDDGGLEPAGPSATVLSGLFSGKKLRVWASRPAFKCLCFSLSTWVEQGQKRGSPHREGHHCEKLEVGRGSVV